MTPRYKKPKAKGRLHDIVVNNIHYKWRTVKESVGVTLKIWKNKSVIVEEWFPCLLVENITSDRIKDIITIEKL